MPFSDTALILIGVAISFAGHEIATRLGWSWDSLFSTKKRRTTAIDPTILNVYQLQGLALREILADDSTAPEEVAHREWLKRRLAQTGVGSIKTKLLGIRINQKSAESEEREEQEQKERDEQAIHDSSRKILMWLGIVGVSLGVMMYLLIQAVRFLRMIDPHRI